MFAGCFVLSSNKNCLALRDTVISIMKTAVINSHWLNSILVSYQACGNCHKFRSTERMAFMWLLSNFKSADAGKQFWDSYKGESHISFREFLKDMFFIVDFLFYFFFLQCCWTWWGMKSEVVQEILCPQNSSIRLLFTGGNHIKQKFSSFAKVKNIPQSRTNKNGKKMFRGWLTIPYYVIKITLTMMPL